MMNLQGEFVSVILAHILQFSVAISLVAALTWFAGRRWPHFAFLVCMLALAKCMVPPLITSPAGIFTRTTSLAFSPKLMDMQGTEMIRLKHVAALPNEVSLTSTIGAATPLLASSYLNLGSIALFCWLLGALLVLAWAIRQYASLLRIVRNCHSAPERVLNLTHELQQRLGISGRVDVLISNDNYGPACVGFFRPKLILPSLLASRWSDRLIRPILAHELVHARRGDCIWGVLQFVAQIVWWFHPMVWWLGRRAYLLCERCCDEEVVSSRQFAAAEYAESLVRVLELKNAFRLVPHCSAMSPAKITSHRLERLMKRCGRFSEGTSRLNWVLAAMLAFLLIPGMHWTQAKDGDKRKEERDYRYQINAAIANGDWTTAIDLLKPVVAREPHNANATFYLGYVLHAQGLLDEAIVYHQRAAEFPQLAPKALYNWACALALQGNNDAAIEKLTKAIELGFMHETDLTDDADLTSLFDQEDFKKLQQHANSTKETIRLVRQLDFWLGHWIVSDENGQAVGENVVSLSDDGHVITERWTSENGNSGTSLNFFHPGENKWKQTRVYQNGEIVEYVGEFQDGRMQYQGSMVSLQGKRAQSRMTITPKDAGTIEQLIERSDDGQAWEVYFQGTYHPDDSYQPDNSHLQLQSSCTLHQPSRVDTDQASSE